MVSRQEHCLADLLSRQRTGPLTGQIVAVVSNHDDLRHLADWHGLPFHHSLLPSFKGARPYFQAHARGVKVIGATARCVTSSLDEGPIVCQEFAPVTHTMSAQVLTTMGRDQESLALSKAVQAHSESHVLLNGMKTIVFQP